MTRRDVLALTAVALLVRAAASVLVDDPPYLDPAYYELVARRLVAGDGFTTPALWSFLEVGGRLPADASLPVPSNAHWMPLTSIVAAASMALLGPSRLAAELPMILAGAALVPLTMIVAWELWGSRRTALLSGILAIFAGPMLVYVPTVDSFAIFGLGGFAALYGSRRVLGPGGDARWMAVAGAGVGLAAMTRIDGTLLAVAPAVAWLIRRRVGPWRVDLPPLSWGWAIACGAVAVAIVLPWLMRQQGVFGTPLPSAGGHTLWITTFNEQFSIGHPVGPQSYFALGWPAIIGQKLESWGLLIGRTAVLLGGTFLFPFAYGLWRERRRAELAPFLVYFLVLFLVMGGLFTLHAPMGAWYHSAWAWLPFAIPLAVGAFVPAAAAIGRWLPIFSRARNQRFLLSAATVGALALSLVGSASLVRSWTAAGQRIEVAAAYLAEQASPTDIVMHVNAPAIALATGLRAIAAPFDPYAVIEEVVRAYEVDWVVVERTPGAETDPLQLWEGADAVDPSGASPDFLPAAPAFDSSEVRIYEVRKSGG